MIEQALYARAGAVSALTDLIGMDPVRFYPDLAPQAPTYPYCVYHLISEPTPPSAMGASTDLIQRRYQVDCWGETAAAARMLADAVQKAFDRYSGIPNPGVGQTTIQDTFRAGVADLFDPAARKFNRAVDIIIWYQES